MAEIDKNIEALCARRGIKPGKMCNDLGLSRSLMTDLRSGRKSGINSATAQKIADYFGVSVSVVLSDGDVSADLLQELRDEDRALLEVARDMTPEQVRIMMEFGRSIKEIGNAD